MVASPPGLQSREGRPNSSYPNNSRAVNVFFEMDNYSRSGGCATGTPGDQCQGRLKGAFWLFGARFPLSNWRTPRNRLLRRPIFAFSILRRIQSSSWTLSQSIA